jgi:formylglycine-generating enzyme required for sulfatase activity
LKQYPIIFFTHLSIALLAWSCNLQQGEEPVAPNEYVVTDSLFSQIHFVKVPKGPYTYGIDDVKKELDYDYWMMKYEVTNQEFFDFIQKGLADSSLFVHGDSIKLYYSGDELRRAGTYVAKILDDRIFLKDGLPELSLEFRDHPVTELSWFGSQAFCQSLELHLPDKYEWEKAARGNTGWNYPWGNDLQSNRANFHNSGDPFDNGTTPFGFYNGQLFEGYQTLDSPSPYGCYDMAGNAWEYTNTPLGVGMPFVAGGGGSFLYHTGAMTQSWYFSKFGYPFPIRIDRPFKSDGCRCIKK